MPRNTKLKLYRTLIPFRNLDNGHRRHACAESERRIVTKVYGHVKEGEPWRVRTNREVRDTLQRTCTVKVISHRLRWCGHVEGTQNRSTPKYKVVQI